MFLVYILPKFFSFFLVPVYTAYLSTEEYGKADFIINISCLLSPFVCLGMPSALLRFTIEDRNNNKPFQISLKITTLGSVLLLFTLFIIYVVDYISLDSFVFTFFIVTFSLISDIYINYSRAEEKMKIITICGVGSSFVGILCNILFIVVCNLGGKGFMLASVCSYAFNILVITFYTRNNNLYKGFFQNSSKKLQLDMLKYSFPLIFSGLSWWIISSSDRFFVTWLCGSDANGLYSIAYKIPMIIQALSNVFSLAWMYTLYDNYKTEEGRIYISRVISLFNFIFLLVCSFLIMINKPLSKIMFSNEFYAAREFVPILLFSVAVNGSSNVVGALLSVYKKTKISMYISLIVCMCNIVFSCVFIQIFKGPIGAAIGTMISFLIYCILNCVFGAKCSKVTIEWKLMFAIFSVVCFESINTTLEYNSWLNYVCLFTIIFLNLDSIILVKNNWKTLFYRSIKS